MKKTKKYPAFYGLLLVVSMIVILPRNVEAQNLTDRFRTILLGLQTGEVQEITVSDSTDKKYTAYHDSLTLYEGSPTANVTIADTLWPNDKDGCPPFRLNAIKKGIQFGSSYTLYFADSACSGVDDASGYMEPISLFQKPKIKVVYGATGTATTFSDPARNDSSSEEESMVPVTVQSFPVSPPVAGPVLDDEDIFILPDGKKYTYEELIKAIPAMQDERVFKKNFPR